MGRGQEGSVQHPERRCEESRRFDAFHTVDDGRCTATSIYQGLSSADGIGPMSLLDDRSRYASRDSSPGCEGIEPDNRLLLRWSLYKYCKLPNCG
ncbi:hypothetical protein Cni_G29476 [Canna indica]|uniref:Uncharacterized protein n=1 Tax=Canna indica TaxID=4628 RepID=A0AAQ3QTC0_9LILI|nr:hypothetical protein Cni_G29476 [Canna indica]